MPSQKTVLITGCSAGGIGDALAQEFHKRNFRVFATARNPKKIAHFEPLGIEMLAHDVTDKDSIAAAVQEVTMLTGGGLDMLLNNSGAGYNVPFLDANIDTAKQMFDVNVFGVVAVTQAFAPLLLQSKGTIVTISSVSAFLAQPLQSMYNASKAAVQMMMDSLRIELAPFGVKVVTVVTAAVGTKFFDNLPEIALPASSLYAPAKKELEQAAPGETIPSPMDPAVFARKVVGDVIKPMPSARIWRGGSATKTWFILTFLWATFPDSITAKMGGIDKLAAKLKAKQA